MTVPALPQSQRKVDGGKIPGAFNIPNCVEIAIFFLRAGTNLTRCTLHGRNPGSTPVNVALANTLMASLSSAWATDIGLFIGTTITFAALQVRDMSDHTLPPQQSTVPGVAGTSPDPLLPLDVSLVLTENVNVRGRGAKGRIYLPGWATNADAGGGIAIQSAVDGTTNMGLAWFNAIIAASLTPCVAKPARQEYLGVTGTHHDQRPAGTATVLSYVCRDAHWDTQRRRDV